MKVLLLFLCIRLISPMKIQSYNSTIVDVVETLRSLIRQRLDNVKSINLKFSNSSLSKKPECPIPNSFYYKGSCFFKSSIKLEKFRRLKNNTQFLLPTSSYHNAAISCQRMNASLASFEDVEEFNEVINWIATGKKENKSMDDDDKSIKLIVGVYSHDGRLRWTNNDKLVDEYKYAKFTYSFERGQRLECPALDISLSLIELPMFITVKCSENLPILCRKVINRCHNSPCKKGQCQNIASSFQCKCPLLYSGRTCDKYSSDAIQTFVGIIIISIVLMVSLFSWTRNRRRTQVAVNAKNPSSWSLLKSNHQSPTNSTFHSLMKSEYDHLFRLRHNHIKCTNKINQLIRLRKKNIRKWNTSFRKTMELLSGFAAIIISILCCVLTFNSQLSHHHNNSNVVDPICFIFKHTWWLQKVYKLPTTKFTVPSYLLIISLLFILSRRKSHTWLCRGYGSVPVVFNPFSKNRRFESAAVFGILALEISHIFDEFIFHAYRYNSHGPLLDLLKQTGLVVLIGARYFPILATLELQPASALCYGLTSCYMWVEVGMKVIHDSMCFSQKPNQLKNLTNILRKSPEKQFFKTLKQYPYYVFALFVACRLTCLFLICSFDKIKRLANNNKLRSATISDVDEECSKEQQYVRYLLSLKQQRRVKRSFVYKLLNIFYSYHPYFVHSKQIINIYSISFILIYYFTFWTLEQSRSVVDMVFRLIRFVFLYSFSQSLTEEKLNSFDTFREKLRNEVVNDLRIITSLTGLLCIYQLVLGLKHYQKQMLQAYKGQFNEIPSRHKFKPGSLVAKALHYPGYMVGYLIWGYLITLSVIFCTTIIVRNLIRFFDVFEYIAKWVVPMFILLLMKFLLISVLSRTAFTQWKVIGLKNTRFLFLFNYFNFFFDCFLGLIMCLSRISQASIAAVFLLSRLDYSMFGRGLERYDRGFASYACWLNLEQTQTHPIMVAFCQLVKDRIIYRRVNISPKKAIDKYIYTRKQVVIMRYHLLITLAKNENLRCLRKHRLKQNENYSCNLKNLLKDTLKKFKTSTTTTSSTEVRYLWE